MRQSSVEALLGRSVALEDEESEARQDWILDTLRYGHLFFEGCHFGQNYGSERIYILFGFYLMYKIFIV